MSTADDAKTTPSAGHGDEEKRETTPPPKVVKDWAARTIRLGQSKPEDSKDRSDHD